MASAADGGDSRPSTGGVRVARHPVDQSSGSTGMAVMLGQLGGTSIAEPVYTLAEELTIDWISPDTSSGITWLGSAPSAAMKALCGLEPVTVARTAGSASPKPNARMLGRRFHAGSSSRSRAAFHLSGSSVGPPVGDEYHRGPVPAVPPARPRW